MLINVKEFYKSDAYKSEIKKTHFDAWYRTIKALTTVLSVSNDMMNHKFIEPSGALVGKRKPELVKEYVYMGDGMIEEVWVPPSQTGRIDTRPAGTLAPRSRVDQSSSRTSSYTPSSPMYVYSSDDGGSSYSSSCDSSSSGSCD